MIRGIPDELHRELRMAAERGHRSLNGEILARLTASVRPAQADAVALLERIQRRHLRLGPIDVDEVVPRRVPDEGRPRWTGGE